MNTAIKGASGLALSGISSTVAKEGGGIALTLGGSTLRGSGAVDLMNAFLFSEFSTNRAGFSV